jgi:hypothetical protein
MATILVLIDDWNTLRFQYGKPRHRLQDLLDVLAATFKQRTDINQVKFRTVGSVKNRLFSLPCANYFVRGDDKLLDDVTDLYVLPARKGNTLGNYYLGQALEQDIQVHDLSYSWEKYA